MLCSSGKANRDSEGMKDLDIYCESGGIEMADGSKQGLALSRRTRDAASWFKVVPSLFLVLTAKRHLCASEKPIRD